MNHFWRVVLPVKGYKYGKWLAEFRYKKDAVRFAGFYKGAVIFRYEVI